MDAQGLAFDTNGDLYVQNVIEVRKFFAASDYAESSSVYVAGRKHAAGTAAVAVDTRSHHLFVAPSFASKPRAARSSSTTPKGTKSNPSPKQPAPNTPASRSTPPTTSSTSPTRRAAKSTSSAPATRSRRWSSKHPTPLHNTSATLRGTVGAEGLSLTQCRFEYIDEAAYLADRAIAGHDGFGGAGSAGCEPPGPSIPASGDTGVSAAVAGLAPATAYRYRIVAEASGGAANSFAARFATPGPPAVETTGASLPGPSEALLGGRVNPKGGPTTYHFEYGAAGPCAAHPCQSTSPRGDRRRRGAAVPRHRRIRPLAGGREHRDAAQRCRAPPRCRRRSKAWRGSAPATWGSASGAGQYTLTYGGEKSGTDVPPLLLTPLKNPSAAGLIETVIPGGTPGSEVKFVAARLTGLESETTYHYRLVADNEAGEAVGGEAIGADMTLTTHAAAPLGNESYPHPPGNDRAWEQVSIPDSGGNPVNFPIGFSADGERRPLPGLGRRADLLLGDDLLPDPRPPPARRAPDRELAPAQRRAPLGLRRQHPELGIRSRRRTSTACSA